VTPGAFIHPAAFGRRSVDFRETAMSRPTRIRRVAVLGAGVMGAQIAAHCANANVSVVLFDLAAKEGDPDGIVKRALDGLKKLEPAPLATADRLALIDIANYDRDLARLADCDLVIEAIAERMDWKHGLYAKVAPHLRADAIFASNTSGLSINALADGCPDSLRSRFCGVHFFNPPRYMALVELIPSRSTDAGAARRARNLPHHDAGQERGARARYAQFRRQPGRRVFDAGGDASHRAPRPGLRRGRRADRPGDRPAEIGHLPHRRRGRARYAAACREDHDRQPAGRSVAPLLRRARLAGRAGREAVRSARRRRPASIARTAGRSRCWTSRRRITATPPAPSPTRCRPFWPSAIRR
jgi:hypothetical protein